MREGGRLQIHATKAVREVLTSPLGMTAVLDAFCGAEWHEPPMEFGPLGQKKDAGPWLYRAISLAGKPPRFASRAMARGKYCVAYQFMDERTGRRLLVAPDVSSVTAELREAQRLTTLNTPSTGQAVIIDVGEENDIHPRKKEPVGDRLALLARGLRRLCTAPSCMSM